jgi:hypothetical protein
MPIAHVTDFAAGKKICADHAAGTLETAAGASRAPLARGRVLPAITAKPLCRRTGTTGRTQPKNCRDANPTSLGEFRI